MTLLPLDSAPPASETGSGLKEGLTVIPAQAGIRIATLDSRLRGNDGTPKRSINNARFRMQTQVLCRRPGSRTPETHGNVFTCLPKVSFRRMGNSVTGLLHSGFSVSV